MIMKTLNQYIQEKLIVNKNYNDVEIVVKSFDELRNIIEDRYDKLGPGTKQNPIDFNDIDVSNIYSFNDMYKGGIFEETKFKYINISYWDVSNVRSMCRMFAMCEELESVGDISKWDVSKVTNMNAMFYGCKYFNQDISDWDVSNVAYMSYTFFLCESFNQNISKWNVSKVTDTTGMFYGCKSFNQNISSWDVSSLNYMSYMFYKCESFNKDISRWDISNVIYKKDAFDNCPIKNEYKPKFK